MITSGEIMTGEDHYYVSDAQIKRPIDTAGTKGRPGPYRDPKTDETGV